MEEKAFRIFISAWDQIKAGNLFDEDANNTFDYMLKNLWRTGYKPQIKTDILKHFPAIFAQSKLSQRPPPLFYILISLKDEDIIKEMQSLLLMDWIKSNASEDATFQMLNFIQTFSDKNISIASFVNTIANNITTTMQSDHVEALAFMISLTHPDYIHIFLKKFLSFAEQDDTLLRNYVRMTGRKAFLMLTQMASPVLLNKIFKDIKK
jgi:hypothetical protein